MIRFNNFDINYVAVGDEGLILTRWDSMVLNSSNSHAKGNEIYV